MFDIRKIQEQVIYGAVKRASNAETAREIVYGKDELARTENNPTWVNSTMKRLENHFDKSAVNQIRMNCQCGYGMDEKLALQLSPWGSFFVIIKTAQKYKVENSRNREYSGKFCTILTR